MKAGSSHACDTQETVSTPVPSVLYPAFVALVTLSGYALTQQAPIGALPDRGVRRGPQSMVRGSIVASGRGPVLSQPRIAEMALVKHAVKQALPKLKCCVG